VVGALVFPPKRLTWTLFRSLPLAPTRVGSAVHLRVLCQEGKARGARGVSLTGKENEEATWVAPTLTEYAGTVIRTSPLTYRLSSDAGTSALAACEPFPARLRLECHSAQISVLAAGAALIPGKKLSDDRMSPSRFQPSRRERVSALRCDLASESDPATWPSRHVPREWPLLFAAPSGSAVGVEWAYENSDMVVQEGAYRWMPAPP
jgi:hypothetical protein